MVILHEYNLTFLWFKEKLEDCSLLFPELFAV